MRYRLILPIAALLAALVAVPAAQAKVRVGLSEQNPAMFDQPNWQQLKLKKVRYIVSWDYTKAPDEHQAVKNFMNAAHVHKQDVLVEFNAHRGCFVNNKYKKKTKACKAPSTKAYKAAVKGFRKEFPYAKTFAPWNEVNHVSQPTYRKPKLAAKYFKAMKSVCKKCTVMAADVLDSSDVASYLRKFQTASKHKGRIWGLHNYKDVNRHQSKGIKHVASVTKGQIWLTETGGFVQFKGSGGFKYSLKRAAKATKYMFSLAKKNKRVKRIYVYRWFGEPRSARFDAGLVDEFGGSRPGLKQFKKSIKGLPR
jgi:Glycosyl hydrolase catalytic core